MKVRWPAKTARWGIIVGLLTGFIVLSGYGADRDRKKHHRIPSSAELRQPASSKNSLSTRELTDPSQVKRIYPWRLGSDLNFGAQAPVVKSRKSSPFQSPNSMTAY